jgi:CBS domain containing-hemolysin-like protein
MAIGLAPMFNVYCTILWPMIWLLNHVCDWFMRGIGRLFGVIVNLSKTQAVHSPEELEILINESASAGELGKREAEILTNALDLEDMPISKAMIPRSKMACVPEEIMLEDLESVIIDTMHSKLPVYRGTMDNIVGVVNTKDLFKICGEFKVSCILRPILRTSPGTSARVLLDEMRSQATHMAVVVEKDPGSSAGERTVGLITMEDVLEELVGDIRDEYDKETRACVETTCAGSGFR